MVFSTEACNCVRMGQKTTLPATLRQIVSALSGPTRDRMTVHVTPLTLHTLESNGIVAQRTRIRESKNGEREAQRVSA